jgi:chaperonin GroEL (HSP60 family)
MEGNEDSRTNFNVFLLPAAVSDAIRTSLGPRGMDKMVSWMLFIITTTC